MPWPCPPATERDGSSLALAGASTPAEAPAATRTDHEAAFRRYETEHRRSAAPEQRAVGATALLIPASRIGITARNAATHLIWPANSPGSHWS
ncbi:hypothetical protein [Streptomyces cavernicola]|uniref:Uncharacterized protein n=1 Tax=Streptomyces cavernicola TaxID=3043613 RepID=A0ABT6S9Z8_9ACTN|nr:hypothetical protein [Streptomyces sp. B-S-A6]MDI3405006.1 hypothetical protein [Streptomyces sp. B-S-A6]